MTATFKGNIIHMSMGSNLLKKLTNYVWRSIREMQLTSNNVSVGLNFTFGKRCRFWAPKNLKVGNHVSCGSNVRIEVDGTIGDFVLIASNVGIVGRSDHAIDEIGTPTGKAEWVGNATGALSQPVQINDDVWIGYGATVLSGVSIGFGSVIGAGAVVTRDIPENSIVVGNPARVIRNRFTSEEFAQHKSQIEIMKAQLAKIKFINN